VTGFNFGKVYNIIQKLKQGFRGSFNGRGKGLLFRGEPERLLIGGDTISQILNELDSIFSWKMC